MGLLSWWFDRRIRRIQQRTRKVAEEVSWSLPNPVEVRWEDTSSTTGPQPLVEGWRIEDWLKLNKILNDADELLPVDEGVDEEGVDEEPMMKRMKKPDWIQPEKPRRVRLLQMKIYQGCLYILLGEVAPYSEWGRQHEYDNLRPTEQTKEWTIVLPGIITADREAFYKAGSEDG